MYGCMYARRIVFRYFRISEFDEGIIFVQAINTWLLTSSLVFKTKAIILDTVSWIFDNPTIFYSASFFFLFITAEDACRDENVKFQSLSIPLWTFDYYFNSFETSRKVCLKQDFG